MPDRQIDVLLRYSMDVWTDVWIYKHNYRYTDNVQTYCRTYGCQNGPTDTQKEKQTYPDASQPSKCLPTTPKMVHVCTKF